MTPAAMAKRIARAIFAAGDQPHDKVQRIEFRGGRYPGRETALGGFNEAALANEIEQELERIAHPGKTGPETFVSGES